MKVYLLWFNEWEANNLLGIFENRADAERWRTYFLDNQFDEEDDDYILSTLAHYATNGDLDKRLQIGEHEVNSLCHIKIDNLKLLEWESKKNEGLSQGR